MKASGECLYVIMCVVCSFKHAAGTVARLVVVIIHARAYESSKTKIERQFSVCYQNGLTNIKLI